MKAEDRKQLETNSLASGVGALVERAKTGRLANPWVLAVAVAVLLGGGLWWYLAAEGRKVTGRSWREFLTSTTPTDLRTVVDGNKDSAAARTARLEIARLQLGPDGIGKLQTADREQRNKGIENIEKAREELTRLADEFKGDPTMRATCLLTAAEAELALVGIPASDSGAATRGTVDKAVELYREVAKVVGEQTPPGETYRKRADELEAQKTQVEDVARQLNERLSPPPSFGSNPLGPKPPTTPIPTPTPPPGADLKDGPQGPAGPITPPATTPTPAPTATKDPDPKPPAAKDAKPPTVSPLAPPALPTPPLTTPKDKEKK